MVKKSTNDVIKQIIFLLLLFTLGAFLFFELSEFLTALLGAIIFYVLFRSMMKSLTEKYRWPKGGAALLIMLITFIIVLVPVFFISYMLYSKVSGVLNDPSSMISLFYQLDAKLKAATGISLESASTIDKIKVEVANIIPQFLSRVLSSLLTIAAMYFLLYFMLINYGTLEKTLEDNLPLDKVNTNRLGSELRYMTYANAVGVPFIAIIQSATLILGFWMFGLDEPFFWGVIAGVCSFLPVLGTGLVWIPAGIYMIASGHMWDGIFIFIWGSVVIGVMDQFLRSMISNRIAKVHPVITIFGAIIGLEIFGFPGLIFGPLLISYFLILIQIYKDEFMTEE